MNAPFSITAPLDEATLTNVQDLARARGISEADFAADAIRSVVERDIEWRAFVQEGIDSADRGELISQEEMVAWFEERVAARRRG